MKLNKKGKRLLIGGFIIFFLLLLIFLLNINKDKGSIIYAEYVAGINAENIVSNHIFRGDIASIITNEAGIYNCLLFNYKTGEKITWEKVIKENKKVDFLNKIKELLYLKYPTFIADALMESTKCYAFYSDKLVIYYYNVSLEYEIEEDFLLTVSYADIKEFLTFIGDEIKIEYITGFDIDPNKKHIALTFDDGPSKYTEELSNILLENKAHATFFFVTKNILNNPNPVIAVDKVGHEIGYHSYNHTSFLRQNIDTLKEEFTNSNAIIEKLIGKKYSLTRPPYGSINNNVKQAIDTPFILWNIDTCDWRYKDADYLYEYVLDNVKDGDIILFHDSYSTSIEAIKKLLPKLYTLNYQVVSVSTLAEIKNEELIVHGVYRYFK